MDSDAPKGTPSAPGPDEEGLSVPRTPLRSGTRIGLIADTHGSLDPDVVKLFAGVDHIVHAGDVGKRGVLRRLEKIAPVTAVAGNTDSGKLAKELPQQALGECGGVRFLVAHKPKHLKHLLRKGIPDGIDLIVTGHLHEPTVHWEDDVLRVNPGTASSPEEGDPGPTVAVVSVSEGRLSATFMPVRPAGPAGRKPPAVGGGTSE